MSTQIPTLRDLFATGHARRREGRALPPPPAALAVLGRFQWQGIYDKALDLLDISILDVMLGVWKKHAEFRKHVRISAADPTKTVVVHLGSHRITSEHRPAMEVRRDGSVLAELTFPVEVAFEVEAVELTLRGGAVREIRTGELKVRGTVKFEETVILERDLEPIRLPGKMTLRSEQPVVHGSMPLTSDTRPPLEEYLLVK